MMERVIQPLWWYQDQWEQAYARLSHDVPGVNPEDWTRVCSEWRQWINRQFDKCGTTDVESILVESNPDCDTKVTVVEGDNKYTHWVPEWLVKQLQDVAGTGWKLAFSQLEWDEVAPADFELGVA